jgi:hypothetical protein
VVLVTFAFLKILGLALAWKSGFKVLSLPLQPCCPLKTILLSDWKGSIALCEHIMAFFSRA